MAKRPVHGERDPEEDIRAAALELELHQDEENSLLQLDSELDSQLNGPREDPEPLDDREAGLLLEENASRLYQEKLRQEMGDVETSISERERGIKALEEAQELLEDQLEDANAEIDRLRRELDKMALETEEARYQQREAEEARKSLEAALYKMQEGAEDARAVSLRDERLQSSGRALDFSSVTRGPMMRGAIAGLVVGLLCGIGVAQLLGLF